MARIPSDEGSDRRRKRRLVLALVLTLSLVTVLAVTGGIGSAASSVSSGSSAVKRLVSGTPAKSNSASSDTTAARNVAAVSGNSSALAQYGNKVVICHHPSSDPTKWRTIVVPQSALAAHLEHGDTLGRCKPVKRTRLRVSITPKIADVTSGTPIPATIVTRNVGKARAWNVVTCVSLPPGITVAKSAGGFALKGRYCWRTKMIVAGARATFRFQIRGDARLAARVQLVASAQAANAPRVGAVSRLTVLPARASGQGGFTG